MADTSLPTPGIPIGRALSQLPLETPEHSAWPLLAMRVAKRPAPTRHWPWALAAAAAMALLAVLPLRSPDAPNVVPAVAVDADTQVLMALMNESAQLEQLLSALDRSEVASASATLLSLDIEDRLRQIDARLSATDSDRRQQLTLWQQRVELLRDYAGLESTRHWLASQGERLDGSLVTVF